MSHHATTNFKKSEQFTNLTLIGGRDCIPGVPMNHQSPDLWVQGGAIIERTLCVNGNVVAKNFIGNVCADTVLTTTLKEKYTGEGIEIIGNLNIGDITLDNIDLNCGNLYNASIVQVDRIIPSGCLTADNTVRFVGNASVSENLDVTGKVTAEDLCVMNDARFSEDIIVDGDIMVQGNIMAPFINIQGNCILSGDSSASVCVYEGGIVTIGGDTTMANTLRVQGNVQFDQNLNVDNKLTANDLCANDSATVNGKLTTGNADVLGKLDAGELCVDNGATVDGNLTAGNANILGKLTTQELCLTGDADIDG